MQVDREIREGARLGRLQRERTTCRGHEAAAAIDRRLVDSAFHQRLAITVSIERPEQEGDQHRGDGDASGGEAPFTGDCDRGEQNRGHHAAKRHASLPDA